MLMKTGIVVLGQHSHSINESRVAKRCVDYLESKGHRNVRMAYHHGTPDSLDVISSMFLEEGIDTFAILPLNISEGNMTIWNMPKKIGLPDNSGSWTLIGGRDIATRFATALNFDKRMADAIVRQLGEPDDSTGILFLIRGSRLSQAERTAEHYSDCVRAFGWKAAYATAQAGSISAALEGLRGEGATSVRVIPLYVGFDGPSSKHALRNLEGSGIETIVEPAVSEMQEYYEILESKVPEGW